MPTTDRPKLRLLDSNWTEQNGQPVLVLRDRLGLTNQVAFIPPVLAFLFSLFDGKRDHDALRAAFTLQTGLPLGERQLADIIGQLDQALLLDSPRFDLVKASALAEYRSASARPMALADQVYPADAEECRRDLDGYAPDEGLTAGTSEDGIRGVICPHIDYQRGGPVYYRTWLASVRAVEAAEIVVLFGTDHHGGSGRLTLTRQSYNTPFGVLPTATEVVDAVAEAIGDEAAFGEELNHRAEHSIELGAVWLGHALAGRLVPIVPILCGSFHELIDGTAGPETKARIDQAIEALARGIAGRRALVVAAADLAHVGPDFGDSNGFGQAERSRLASADSRLLDLIRQGDAEGFLEEVRREGDRFRVCGVPPIYLALRLLRELAGDQGSPGRTTSGGPSRSSGEVLAYEQCPTPADNGSWVSIAGALLR